MTTTDTVEIPTTSPAASSLESSKAHAKVAAEEFAHAAEEKVSELRHSTDEYLDQFKNRVRREPVKSVGIAFAVGFIYGFLRR